MPATYSAFRPGAIGTILRPYGITQGEFAEQIGANPSTIARANSGAPVLPSFVKKVRAWIEEHGEDPNILREHLVAPNRVLAFNRRSRSRSATANLDTAR